MKSHGQKNTSMQRNWQQGKEQIWQKVLLVYNLRIIVYDMISKNEENTVDLRFQALLGNLMYHNLL